MKYFHLVLIFVLVTEKIFALAVIFTKNRDMQFSTSSPNDGAAIINATDSTSSKFTITGNPGESVSITFPSGTIDMVNGASTIAATTWTSDAVSPVILDGTGNATIYIGATRAAITAGQISGVYTGNHSISIQYTTLLGPIRTATASHTVTVVPSISISNTSGLQFPNASRNDAAATIAAGASGASFTVTGEASMVYTVSLPADNTVVMSTAGGGTADKEIAVNTFTSSPSGSGTIGGGGTDTLYVGATRAAIRNTQVQATDYTGSFMVVVTYQ